ncbi:MAG TPA: hypothetical protein VIC84_23055 [Blastocatellia bacterium]
MAEKSDKEKLIDEAQTLVARIVSVKFKLRENECQFVMELDEKLKRYGYGTFVSDKQMNWLKILDKQYSPDERQAELFG